VALDVFKWQQYMLFQFCPADFTFTQQCFQDPGLLCYCHTVAGLRFPNVVKEFSAFIFNPECLGVKALHFLEMWGETNSLTQYNISEDWEP
jgi:hypothetical protein